MAEEAPKRRGRPKKTLMRPKPHIICLQKSVQDARRRNVLMPPRSVQRNQPKQQRIDADMPESSNSRLQRLKRLLLATVLPQSILGIWMYCQTQYRTLLQKVKSFFNRIADLKQTFYQRVKGMFSTAVLPVVEKVLHFLLIRYVIVTILIIVVFFSVVHSTSLPN